MSDRTRERERARRVLVRTQTVTIHNEISNSAKMSDSIGYSSSSNGSKQQQWTHLFRTDRSPYTVSYVYIHSFSLKWKHERTNRYLVVECVCMCVYAVRASERTSGEQAHRLHDNSCMLCVCKRHTKQRKVRRENEKTTNKESRESNHVIVQWTTFSYIAKFVRDDLACASSTRYVHLALFEHKTNQTFFSFKLASCTHTINATQHIQFISSFELFHLNSLIKKNTQK